ncbi:MAG: sulfatase [Bacteroidota bacterium]
MRFFFIFLFFSFPLSQVVIGQQKLNVLFICVDDLRPDLRSYGDKTAITPNIDRLAKQGMQFERAYCQRSLCAPSRASLMTGLRPDTLPIISEDVHFRTILPDVVTLPQFFKQQGYHTQAFGKVYHAYPPQPDDISWTVPERILDVPKRDEYLMPENRVRGFINPMEKGTSTEAVETVDEGYQDGQVALAAIETLDTIKHKPFFLAVGFKRPHLPFTVPKKYWDMYKREDIPLPADMLYPKDDTLGKLRYDWQPDKGEMRNYTDIPQRGDVSPEKARELIHGYYACISYIDVQVGRVLRALDSLGLREKTIVILWSDNGYLLGERGLWGKKDNSEKATRVALMMDVPGMKNRGVKTNGLVELVDIFPTLTELCGIKFPGVLQGTSMVPLLKNPGLVWKKAAYSSFARMNNTVMAYTVRTAKYRYHEYREKKSGKMIAQELYDMDKDPLEKTNLVNEKTQKETVATHMKLLKEGWKSALPSTALTK